MRLPHSYFSTYPSSCTLLSGYPRVQPSFSPAAHDLLPSPLDPSVPSPQDSAASSSDHSFGGSSKDSIHSSQYSGWPIPGSSFATLGPPSFDGTFSSVLSGWSSLGAKPYTSPQLKLLLRQWRTLVTLPTHPMIKTRKTLNDGLPDDTQDSVPPTVLQELQKVVQMQL